VGNKVAVGKLISVGRIIKVGVGQPPASARAEKGKNKPLMIAAATKIITSNLRARFLVTLKLDNIDEIRSIRLFTIIYPDHLIPSNFATRL